ncbi:MAG: hypothetical protein K6U10_02535 [Acidobacteriia bacterium]|nr:hypothetical protein [Methyloceanibacter sp.]MBX5472778.1 hypothetical protein [Acetobacteraceae bacterium]MCL6490679.1 hypothetical protein [Terriglobia bacterium]
MGFEKMGNKWSCAGFHCVPLVTRDQDAICSLNILLLRPGPSTTRHIINQGDIDGQLKTIVDALRIPDGANKIRGVAPGADEDPFFCLLEDDKLVSEVRVVTDELLLLPGKREVDANDAFVVINAKVWHKNPRTFDNWLG